MDLAIHFRKIRELEETIAEEAVVTVSLATSEGGKAGVFSEVPKRTAAKMVVENKARLATAEEATEYRTQVIEAHEVAERNRAIQQGQYMLVPQPGKGRSK